MQLHRRSTAGLIAMSGEGSWPKGALPMGPSLYEDAMLPIYQEAVWRERNFYKANEEDVKKPGGDPASRPPAPVVPSLLTTITSPVKDFSAWLTPNGNISWPRALVVVGGLVIVGYLFSKR